MVSNNRILPTADSENHQPRLDLNFFDSSFTFTNTSIEVGCCSRNSTLTKVTCGKGMSCTAQCAAIKASLCPSGKCTRNPEDCRPRVLPDDGGEEGPVLERANLPDWALRWCTPGGNKLPCCVFYFSYFGICFDKYKHKNWQNESVEFTELTNQLTRLPG